MIPGLVTLRHYWRSWLRGDLLAGVTVAAYLVPQVMAYAMAAQAESHGVIMPMTVYVEA